MSRSDVPWFTGSGDKECFAENRAVRRCSLRASETDGSWLRNPADAHRWNGTITLLSDSVTLWVPQRRDTAEQFPRARRPSFRNSTLLARDSMHSTPCFGTHVLVRGAWDDPKGFPLFVSRTSEPPSSVHGGVAGTIEASPPRNRVREDRGGFLDPRGRRGPWGHTSCPDGSVPTTVNSPRRKDGPHPCFSRLPSRDRSVPGWWCCCCCCCC